MKRDRISKESFFAVSQQKVDEEIDIESMILVLSFKFYSKVFARNALCKN